MPVRKDDKPRRPKDRGKASVVTKARLYKGRYLIALYDQEDEWCIHPIEAGDATCA